MGKYVLRRPCIKRQEKRKELFGNMGLNFAADIASSASNMVIEKSYQQSNKVENDTKDNIMSKQCSENSEASSSSNGNTALENHENSKSPLPELIQSGSNVASFTNDDTVTKAPSTSIASSSKKSKYKLNTNGVPRRVTSLGNKRMSVSDDTLPDLCRRIGIQGTNKRMDLINKFASDYPDASVRQVTIKFSEITVKVRPACVEKRPKESVKKKGKGTVFYLRPRMYKYLPEEERPKVDWQSLADEDEVAWKKEVEKKAELERLEKEEKKEESKKRKASRSMEKAKDSKRKKLSIGETASATASVVAEPVSAKTDSGDETN